MTTEEIALQVAKEWQMAFGGVELDFALEVAKRAVESEREACAVASEMLGFDEAAAAMRARVNPQRSNAKYD